MLNFITKKFTSQCQVETKNDGVPSSLSKKTENMYFNKISDVLEEKNQWDNYKLELELTNFKKDEERSYTDENISNFIFKKIISSNDPETIVKKLINTPFLLNKVSKHLKKEVDLSDENAVGLFFEIKSSKFSKNLQNLIVNTITQWDKNKKFIEAAFNQENNTELSEILNSTSVEDITKLKNILKANVKNESLVSNIYKIITLTENASLFVKAAEEYANIKTDFSFEQFVENLITEKDKTRLNRILSIVASSKELLTAMKDSKEDFYYSRKFHCLIDGRGNFYIQEKRSGKGAMKTVDIALRINDFTKKNVFMTISFKGENSEFQKELIENEFTLLKELQNTPYIMPYFKAVIKNNSEYIVLQEKMKRDGRLLFTSEVGNILKNFSEFLIALSLMHKAKILHGDIKPENFLISKKDVLYISDFGFAKKTDETGIVSAIGATPGYDAPEFKDGPMKEKLTKAYDNFSAGASLIEIIINKIGVTNSKEYKQFLTNDNKFSMKSLNLGSRDGIFVKYFVGVIKSKIQNLDTINNEEKSTLIEMLEIAHKLIDKDPEKRLSDVEAVEAFFSIINSNFPNIQKEVNWGGIIDKEKLEINDEKPEITEEIIDEKLNNN